MIDETLKSINESYRDHGINNYCVIVGVEQQESIRKLEGFISASVLNPPKAFGTAIVIGRIESCWLAVWDKIPSNYVYASEVFDGYIRPVEFRIDYSPRKVIK